MTAIFEMPMPSEILTDAELAEICGCSRKADQLKWLKDNRWVVTVNRAQQPIVGRLYARLRLAGISPSQLAPAAAGGWELDTSKVR